jgi:hypothetical protein
MLVGLSVAMILSLYVVRVDLKSSVKTLIVPFEWNAIGLELDVIAVPELS